MRYAILNEATIICGLDGDRAPAERKVYAEAGQPVGPAEAVSVR